LNLGQSPKDELLGVVGTGLDAFLVAQLAVSKHLN